MSAPAPFLNGMHHIMRREHQLENFPMLRGRWVDVTFAANSASATANHKLGREYIGAISVMLMNPGVSAGSDIDGLLVESPEFVLTVGVNDPAEVVVFTRTNAGGTAGALTIRAWVF